MHGRTLRRMSSNTAISIVWNPFFCDIKREATYMIRGGNIGRRVDLIPVDIMQNSLNYRWHYKCKTYLLIYLKIFSKVHLQLIHLVSDLVIPLDFIFFLRTGSGLQLTLSDWYRLERLKGYFVVDSLLPLLP